MDEILQVRHLKQTFPRRDGTEILAVDDVSFDVYKGEKLALIGESGSGKTTVAKIIALLLEPTVGQVLLAGEDITRAKGKKLKKAYTRMQMVFQNPVDSFDPRCTLGDGIGESLINQGKSSGQAAQITQNLLALCGLGAEFAHRYPHEVSGGQCQRAAIARALAIEPDLVILDEATSALDVTVQAEILDLLNRLQEDRGIAYLFICHDIALVQDFCDRVIVMHEGRIVEEGIPDDVIQRPQQAYTRRLIDSVL
ncbi:MAG: dipeptide/oligopeptide/nickel ABC transporter ATP-binding protein [Selenomonas sp.]|uniref:ABC transporter ATP-binding protein n=1 Tax=Selenomonas sp. TaxID=2053611 RepID=UPI0025F02B9C|nr:dipeptide/oligopeptide/nickel ABC transporter ATP-binding protein [Selenomonas sp.]MCR5756452.1 dipeptide/oligopeptide/nickel ABC transporter ATP-binding protein [Selenomonas sp.]